MAWIHPYTAWGIILGKEKAYALSLVQFNLEWLIGDNKWTTDAFHRWLAENFSLLRKILSKNSSPSSSGCST